MQVNEIFTQDSTETNSKSVFLAGPTPRSKDVSSWRPEAISIFKRHIETPLSLFIPEPNWNTGITFAQLNLNYGSEIIEWEHEALEKSDIILMWVPRDLDTMPAFTTNLEFGMFVKNKNFFYGRPDNAPKTRYLDFCYEKFTGRKPQNTLKDLIIEIIEQI